MSFFSSALFGGPIDLMHVFQGVTALAESGVRFPLLSGFHAFVPAVRLFSALQSNQ